MTGDLGGLEKLWSFEVPKNPIEHIGQHFFAGNSSITNINFYDCHINKIDAGAFDDLKNLELANFHQNICLDELFHIKNKKALTKFKQATINKCLGRGKAVESHNLLECKLTSSKGLSNFSFILLSITVFSACLTLLLSFALWKIFASQNVKEEEDYQFINQVFNDMAARN